MLYKNYAVLLLFMQSKIMLGMFCCGDNAAQIRKEQLKLHEAVRYKDLADVRQIINENKSCIQSKNEQGVLAIHWAAYRGDCAIAQELIENGSPIDDKDLHKFTPLYMAAIKGHKAMAKLLIRQGASTKFSSIYEINIRQFMNEIRQEMKQQK